MTITTAPYRIPRYLLARLAAEEYVRRFWWFVLIIPVSGVLMMTVGSGVMQAIGMFAILWPVTIPARAILGSWNTGTFFSSGVRLDMDEEFLYFKGEGDKGMKLRIASVRSFVERYGFLILRFGIGEFVAIPVSALGDQKDALVRALESDEDAGD